MKSVLTLTCLLSLLGLVRVSAEPLIEGRVRLDSGEPVADAQVRIFDMTDLRRGAVARATTDGTGYFALPLAALTRSVLPTSFTLGPNYPNPFNPSTIIPYQLATSSAVRLEVFNLLGQHLATLVDEERAAGFHTATWHATDAAGRSVGAGVYIYRLIGGGQTMSRRMVLVDGQAGVPRGEIGVERLSPVISSWEVDSRVYRLTVSGQGLVPYMDPTFRVEAGMAPVELVVETLGLGPANKATDDTTPVTIPDAKLRAAIEAALGKASGATITKGEMKALTVLNANKAGIRDLTGLESATNLTYLNLFSNTISDVSPLRNLTNLTGLGLGGNTISDVSPLSNLTNLTELYLNGNTISDVSPLSNLTNLTELYLNGNTISDVSPLSNLTNLTNLRLYSNTVSDVSPLSNLTNLTELWLHGNTISDVSPVRNLTNLTSLKLEGNNITDISVLAGLTNLTFLGLGGNNISDISPLRNLTNLIGLSLEGNNISDISVLAGLTNLTFLGLRENPLSASSINEHIPALQDRGVEVEFDPTPVIITDDPTPVTIPDAKLRAAIAAALGKASGATITKGEMSTLTTLGAQDADISDLTGLEFATNLTMLLLDNNRITDLAPLSGLTKLNILGLNNNQIADLAPLAGLTKLTNLHLNGNTITDVSPLRNLTNLNRLGLVYNWITDLAALSGLTKLTNLYLGGNRITDLAPLAGLTNLTNLFIRENPLSDASINDHIPALQARGVTVQFDPTPVVTIPDAKLRAVIESALGKARGATITKSEMSTLRRLIAQGVGISDLTGLEFATNLTSLYLWNNQITDLSPLAGLTNLTNLNLYNNSITDLSPLAGLTKLNGLGLNKNQIADIAPLADLTNLTNLNLYNNSITDLLPLAGLTKLTNLDLNGNTITDVSPLAGLTNLRELNLSGNTITDVSALVGLTNLTELNLSGNSITDISALASLTNLTNLDLNGNTITDVSPLRNLTNLETLGLSDNQITDMSALVGLTNLRILRLNDNPLSASSFNDHIPALQARGVSVGAPPDPTPVPIPDANLRAAIAAALGKASGATITVAEMKTLTTLDTYGGGISDLTGLEFATNLTDLMLQGNNISDIAPLADLTKLYSLWLGSNNISDLAPLAGLTSLEFLGLHINNISDIAPLAGLTKLYRLWLHKNNISDLAPLAGLTSLEVLRLQGNNISDLAPLAGLTGLEFLGLQGNNISDLAPLAGLTKLTRLELGENQITAVSPLRDLTNLEVLGLRLNLLSVSSVDDHIPALERSGATVHFDPPFRKGDFDIELVFLSDRFTEKQKRTIRYAARRWMSIIREDLPDYTFTQGWSGTCGDHSYRIPSGERIDDLRIYITSFYDDPDLAGWGGPDILRDTSSLTVVGCMAFNLNLYSFSLMNVGLHEIGHVLGFGTIWDDLGFLRNPSRGGNEGADTHFNGPLAMAAFDAAGGSSYTGRKVPVRNDGKPRSGDSHWRFSVFGDELMAAGDADVESPLFSEEHYKINDAISAITIQSLADLGYSVDVTQAVPYTLPSAAAKASAKIAAPSTHEQPKWTCGTGQQQEPIYVVDEQGNIIRTLHR